LLSALVGLCKPAAAQVKQLPVAILVVTDGGDQKMRQLETAITGYIKELRSQYGLDKHILPILSYHFNVPEEREYCEKKLGIHRSDLVFIGVCTEEGLVVKKILKSAPRVDDPRSESFQMFQRVALKLGINITPTGGATSAPTPTVAVEGSKIAFKRFVTSNEDGEPCSVFKADDPAIFFNVFVDNLDEQSDHEHTVKLHIRRSDNAVKINLPELGGTFGMKAGVPFKDKEVLALADAEGNGLAVAPVPGSSAPTLGMLPPGSYKVGVEIDGHQVTEGSFSIVPKDFQKVADGKLGILEAFVSDEHGHAMTSFTPTNANGVYCFVTLANLDMDEDHAHQVTVTYIDPTGKVYAHPLGGDFTAVKGNDLSQMEFPDDVDPNHSNGFLMKNNLDKAPTGQWKIQVAIDGNVVRELPFTLSQQ
jgi:hypothetical protein